MNKEIIAVVRLMPGQGGFFDELSRIHLTVGNPQASVFAGMNCAQLRRSVKSGRLKLVSGSLGEEVPPFKLVQHGNNYVLTPNHTEAVEDTVVTAAITPAKAKVEKTVKTTVDKKSEVQPQKNVPAEDAKEVSVETAEETAKEAIKETVDNSVKEPQKEEKTPAKKRTVRKKAADK